MESVEIPKYKCHKEVRAAKITAIKEHPNVGNGSQDLIFGEIGGMMPISDEWVKKFNPIVGGYFVIYEDGYTSFSPNKAFENGYTKI